MFRSHPGWWSAARQAVFALIPLVIGAGMLGAAADKPLVGISRLETTHALMSPLVDDPLVAAPVATEVPAPLAGAGTLAGETVLGGRAVAPATDWGRLVGGALAGETVGGGAGAGAPAFDGAVVGETVPGGDFPAADTRVEDLVAAALAGAGAGLTPAPGVGTGDAGASALVAVDSVSPPSARTETSLPPSTSTPTTQATTTTTTTAPPPPPTRIGRARDTEAEVVPLTNQDRTAAGLGTLSRNACLDAAASGFAEQMARSGVLAHNPGAGAAVNGCRPNAAWGDNVGMSTACDTARLEREWMASAGHRRNILNGAFTLLGVGAWTDEKGACWVQVLFSS